MSGAPIIVMSPQAGDLLSVAGSLPSGITIDAASTATSLILTGSATIADYEAAIKAVRFENTGDTPGGGRTIAVTITDNTGTSSNVALSLITITQIDDPQNSVPGAQTTVQNTNLVFASGNGNSISVLDVDSPTVTTTLTATNGTLTLSDTTGLSFSTGDGTGDER